MVAIKNLGSRGGQFYYYTQNFDRLRHQKLLLAGPILRLIFYQWEHPKTWFYAHSNPRRPPYKLSDYMTNSLLRAITILSTVRPPFRCNRAKEIFAPKKSAPKKSVGKYINEFYHETSLY